MAALTAVDRRAHAATTATTPDMTGLTACLLDRERRHWYTLHETGALGSTRVEISRAAFVAALTGPLACREAKGALKTAGLGPDTDRLLTDHAYCYPSGASGTVLESLSPDRLAEDFLALSIPGHDLPDHAADPWAVGNPELLLPVVEPVSESHDGRGHGDHRRGSRYGAEARRAAPPAASAHRTAAAPLQLLCSGGSVRRTGRGR
ncbi:hypothetical protein OG520_42770 (plasmid) [Streptomyces sp. NBC_00984]|uniref:hypothetical protein n=1 Tax=Streptomyces sp. NBC_00984 TaxID=2903700 RepID=UPI002F90AA40|nr:hypothetical protein OG520_42770 [Streptomyces sp. NBC_00984]